TGNLGNYFANQTRDSTRVEWVEAYSRRINGLGPHDLKFGSLIARTTNSGEFSFRPLEIRDQNQRLLQRIEFTAGTPFSRSDVEHSLFAQDRWMPIPNVAIGGGLRVEHQTVTSTWRMAPRLGVAWTPSIQSKFTLRGGFGVFYDGVPLGVYSFLYYPEQV